MAKSLNWHGIAHCQTCEWKFDESGTVEAINVDSAANKHWKAGHGVTTSLHRLDYCKTLGCGIPETVPD